MTDIPETDDRLDPSHIILEMAMWSPEVLPGDASAVCPFCLHTGGQVDEWSTHDPECLWRRANDYILKAVRLAIDRRRIHLEEGGCPAIAPPTPVRPELWCDRPAGHTGTHIDPEYGPWTVGTGVAPRPAAPAAPPEPAAQAACEALIVRGGKERRCRLPAGHDGPHSDGDGHAWNNEAAEPQTNAPHYTPPPEEDTTDG